MNWYYYDSQKPVGPLSVEAMHQLRNCGLLNAETPVAPEGADNWQAFDVALANFPTSPPPPPKGDNGKAAGRTALSKLAAGVGAMAGLEATESKGGFRALFKDAFKKRKIEEMEAAFAIGTPETTPELGTINTHWPAPWVFFRLIIFSIVATVGFHWAMLHFGNSKLIPGWIFVGAFGIPFSVLVFFMEANVLRNVSFYRILKLLMLGGLLSLILTLVLHQATGLGVIGPMAAGPIEEFAKILAVVLFTSKWKDMNWTLNGMLFGAAVGAGFAAFETAGYILDALMSYFVSGGDAGYVIEGVMFSRALWAPFSHVIWTAATGAALWRLKEDRAFSFAMLTEWQFLRVLLLVAAIHAIWNSPLVFPLVSEPWNFFLKFLALGLVGWVLILLFLQNGLNQIRLAQGEPQLESDSSPTTADASPSDKAPQSVDSISSNDPLASPIP